MINKENKLNNDDNTNTLNHLIDKDNNFLPADNMELIKKILEDLMGFGCHFGHPKISAKAKKDQYILYKLNGCNIINLDKTIDNLRNALKLIFNIVNKGDKILFLTTNPMLKSFFKEIAEQCRAFFITVRYQPGTLTNINHFFDKKRKLETLKIDDDDTLTKKEKKVLKNKMENTREYFEGLTSFNELPKLIITIGGEKEYHTIVDEAQKMGVGIISLNDINVDPSYGPNTITIPCNTKSVETVKYILNLISTVILKGYEEYLIYNSKKMLKNEKNELGKVTNRNTLKDVENEMKDRILNKKSFNKKDIPQEQKSDVQEKIQIEKIEKPIN